jgi:CheY-like chemotaxis protein
MSRPNVSSSAEEDVAFYFRLSVRADAPPAERGWMKRVAGRVWAGSHPSAIAQAEPTTDHQDVAVEVLVVDDHPDSVEAVVRMFRKTGRQADCVQSGAAALASLASGRKPRVVLLDVMMPQMDGIEVLKAIRQHPELKDLPVVMLSADRTRTDEAMGLGAQDYVVKPADLAELRQRVAKYLA